MRKAFATIIVLFELAYAFIQHPDNYDEKCDHEERFFDLNLTEICYNLPYNSTSFNAIHVIDSKRVRESLSYVITLNDTYHPKTVTEFASKSFDFNFMLPLRCPKDNALGDQGYCFLSKSIGNQLIYVCGTKTINYLVNSTFLWTSSTKIEILKNFIIVSNSELEESIILEYKCPNSTNPKPNIEQIYKYKFPSNINYKLGHFLNTILYYTKSSRTIALKFTNKSVTAIDKGKKSCSLATATEFALFCFKKSEALKIYPWRGDGTVGSSEQSFSLNMKIRNLKAFSFSDNEVVIFQNVADNGLTNMIVVPHDKNLRSKPTIKDKIYEFKGIDFDGILENWGDGAKHDRIIFPVKGEVKKCKVNY
jgi:hypothetical protein